MKRHSCILALHTAAFLPLPFEKILLHDDLHDFQWVQPLIWCFTGAFWHVLATIVLYQSSLNEAGWTFILWILPSAFWLAGVFRGSSTWKPTPFEQIETEKLAVFPTAIRDTIRAQQIAAHKLAFQSPCHVRTRAPIPMSPNSLHLRLPLGA